MSNAIERFRTALQGSGIDPDVTRQIMAGYDDITDRAKKDRQAAFFRHAVAQMDALLDADMRCAVRDACACSKSGWRLKAMQQVAVRCAGMSLEEKLDAIGRVTYMGKPVLNADGSITAGIGDEGGFHCPCPVFSSEKSGAPVSITYCCCCAGHFRFHYQIALGVKLKTRQVLSSALASGSVDPCRFVFEIAEQD